MTKKDYFAAGEGFIDSRWYGKGETVSMNEGSARYHLLQGSLLTEKPVEKTEEKTKEITNAGDSKPNKGGDR